VGQVRRRYDHDPAVEEELAGSSRSAVISATPTTDHEAILALQRSAGNRAVTSLLGLGGGAVPTAPDAGQPVPDGGQPVPEDATAGADLVVTDTFVPDPDTPPPDTAPPAPTGDRGPVGFVDGGRVGVVPFGGEVDPALLNCPHAFVDGGMTSTVAWSGGGGAGAHGNEGAGTIQTQIPPTYTASAGPAAGKFSSTITAGTGVLTVRRSWVGAFAGNQGNGWYLTAAAVATVNAHETHHVASSRALYATHLAPLEARVANAALGQNAGATAAGAIATHQAAINWAPSITAFQTADSAANAPGGTVDSADVAAGWIVDIGPGTVSGTAFNHRVTNAGEPSPAP
jgi:hypothetical protein